MSGHRNYDILRYYKVIITIKLFEKRLAETSAVSGRFFRPLVCVVLSLSTFNLASFFVAFVRLGHRQYSDQIIVRLYDVFVRDGIPVPSLEAPLAYWPSEENQDRSYDHGNDQYRETCPQDRIDDGRIVFALQLIVRDFNQEFGTMSIWCVASVVQV